jgi:molecular chaperone DnaK (HSP70)
MAETARQGNFRVAAAIDFGTHSTGFAWAPVTEGNQDPASRKVELYYQWPNQPVRAAKTLSAVLLTTEGAVEAWGYTARRKFSTGSAASSSAYYYSFKRMIGGGAAQDTGTFFRAPLSARLPATPEDAADITVAFLREIVRVAVARIKERGYREDDIRWCLTVPAIWDDAAMSRTRTAAVRAGLPADPARLCLVREPEAAALSCLADGAFLIDGRHEPASTALPRGARYLIVDCGGGTVDISAYEVEDSSCLRQIGKTLGGWLGSEYLNDAFINDILARRMGGATRVSDLIRSDPEALLELTDEWEEQKLAVGAALAPDGLVQIEDQVAVRLSSSAHTAIMNVAPDLGSSLRNYIIIEPEELTRIFDGVVDPILDAVDHQMAAVARGRERGAPLDKVLLVGGFAESRYLNLRLRQHLEGRATVHTPAFGAEAVLRGAVHYCYDSAMISARLSRYTYGFAVALPFEEGKDPGECKVTNDYTGEVLCDARFSRVVAIGQSVPVNHEYRTRVWPTKRGQTDLSINLFTSTAPDPRYTSESAAHGRFIVDISAMSGWGVPVEQRAVELVFRFGGADITVTATEVETGRTVTEVIAFEQTDGGTRTEDPPATRSRIWRRLSPTGSSMTGEHTLVCDALRKKYAELADQRLLIVAHRIAGKNGSGDGLETARCVAKLSRLLFAGDPPRTQVVFDSFRIMDPMSHIARSLADLVREASRLRSNSVSVTWDFTVYPGSGIRADQTPWGSCQPNDPVRFVVTPALRIDGESYCKQVVYTSPDAGASR